jgi:hypothetical protein
LQLRHRTRLLVYINFHLEITLRCVPCRATAPWHAVALAKVAACSCYAVVSAALSGHDRCPSVHALRTAHATALRQVTPLLYNQTTRSPLT